MNSCTLCSSRTRETNSSSMKLVKPAVCQPSRILSQIQMIYLKCGQTHNWCRLQRAYVTMSCSRSSADVGRLLVFVRLQLHWHWQWRQHCRLLQVTSSRHCLLTDHSSRHGSRFPPDLHFLYGVKVLTIPQQSVITDYIRLSCGDHIFGVSVCEITRKVN